MNVQFINDNTIRFQKLLWHDSELLLGKCFGFTIDSEKNTMDCNIPTTSDRSIFEFVKIAFKSFNESLTEAGKREMFYDRLEARRAVLNQEADNVIRARLPYYDKLYKHQVDVLHESYYKQFNLLAMEMGTGKTLTSASLSRIHQIPRTVIMCPAAVKFNWYHDLKKFGFNDLYFTMLDSTKRRTFRAFSERFVIVNYDIIGNFEKEISCAEVGHFILDECHMIKNSGSARFRNVKRIIEQFPNAKISLLSGSPIKNRVNDVFAYLKLAGHELGHNHKKFLEEYTIKTSGRGGERVTGGRNLQDLHIKLSNFMIRKTKAECLDLPDKVYFSYKYELDDYRPEYDKVIKEMSEQKEMSALSGSLHSLNILTSKAKIKGIIEIANTILEEDRKVVIFGGYKEPLKMLEEHFGESCVKIDGSVNSWQRDQNVQKFINDPNCKVFLGNMIAAGVGINLVNASDVIFINFPFVPADLYQSIDRLHRIGQNKSVNVHYTFCEESIDDHIYSIILDKDQDINAVVDNGTAEEIVRENFNEILIKKLLNRNDIVFKNPFSKAVVSAETTEAINSENKEKMDEKSRIVPNKIESLSGGPESNLLQKSIGNIPPPPSFL